MPFSVFSNSKIQKYSPTESAKVYDKAVNRKNNIHFHPRQTLDFIQNNMAQASLTNEIKRHVVRQYLDVSHQSPNPSLLFAPVCHNGTESHTC